MMVFPVESYFFDVVDEMSRSEKYRSYLSDADKFITPYRFEQDPVESFSIKLGHAGFKIMNIALRVKVFVHPNLEHLESK